MLLQTWDQLANVTGSAIFRDGLLVGSHVLVTGGGTGIGFACARELGLAGARVTIVARRSDVLAEACSKLADLDIDAHWYSLNIRDHDAVEEVVARIAASRGLPDHLINNAGGQFAARAENISSNGFRAVMDLNVQGTWHMSSVFAQAHRAAGRPGRIINIVFCHTDAMERFAHAAASRAAVVNLTRTLALEWGQDILVNAIGPGPVKTEALNQYDEAESGATKIPRMPVPRWGNPEDIAWLAAYLLSPAGDWITGSLFSVDGGAQLVGRRWEI